MIGDDQKRLATACARAALAGVILYATENDRGKPVFIVTRAAVTRELHSLETTEAWLDAVTNGDSEPA